MPVTANVNSGGLLSERKNFIEHSTEPVCVVINGSPRERVFTKALGQVVGRVEYDQIGEVPREARRDLQTVTKDGAVLQIGRYIRGSPQSRTKLYPLYLAEVDRSIPRGPCFHGSVSALNRGHRLDSD